MCAAIPISQNFRSEADEQISLASMKPEGTVTNMPVMVVI